MKFKLENSFSQTIPSLLRSCGYKRIDDKKTATISYVRQLTRQHYPRFHLYLQESEKEVVVSLHLDQTKTRFENHRAHRADYESDEVKTELYRIYKILQASAS